MEAEPENVFCIFELLHKILSYTDIASAARSARVCKTWSEVALRSVWYQIDNVRNLFSVLATIETKPGTNGELGFARNLSEDDWDVFSKYAPYVNRLVLSGQGYTLLYLYREVSRTRTTLTLLPNLRFLKIDCNCAVSGLYSMMFLQESLQEISIVGYFTPALGDLCKNIVRRSPNITKLSMGAHWPISSTREMVAPFLGSLKNLRQICFNDHFLTDDLFSALSRLQHLEKILLFSRCTVHTGVSDFHPIVQDGSFPKLRVLEISIKLEEAVSLFSGPFNASAITDLRLLIDCHRNGERYKRFFECISTHCPSLVSLDITSEWWFDPEDDPDTLTIDVFRSLFRLTAMERFAFRSSLLIVLGDEGLAELARSWKKLKTLSFKGDSSKLTFPMPGISVLQHFALHCPNLESLCLCMDATNLNTSSLEISLAKFCRLRYLDVGGSPIGNIRKVALYLSQICSECNITLQHNPECQSGADWDAVSMILEVTIQALKLGKRKLQAISS